MISDNAARLRAAIYKVEVDLARLVVAYRNMKPYVDLLDIVLGEAHKVEKHQAVQACLKAEAEGETAHAMLLNFRVSTTE